MEPSPSPLTSGEEQATSGPPPSIILDDTPSTSDFLQGASTLAPHQPFEVPPQVEKDPFLKSFFMFVLGLAMPILVFFLIAFLGEVLDDEAYDRYEREREEQEEKYAPPYQVTMLQNETGVYSATIDLPDTHELSQCSFRMDDEYLSCGTLDSEQVNNNSGDLAVRQYSFQPYPDFGFAPPIALLDADYSFQSKELSLLFDEIISENLSLDVYALNEQNQFSKTSVSGETSDGKNFIFQNLMNTTDEFYMEMQLHDLDYFFSAEACDSCLDESFSSLDQVRFNYRASSVNMTVIGHYDSQSNELSLKPLPAANGEPFPEQLVFDIGIDWAPIAQTNNTTWVSIFDELTDFPLSGKMWDYGRVNVNHPIFGYRTGYYHPPSLLEFSANENGTYERTFNFDLTDSLPLIDCHISSFSWPQYYDREQPTPIYCDTPLHGIAEYETMIFEQKPFEIEEHVSILNQSWDPVNREFRVEFNRTLIVEENGFYASELYTRPYNQNPDSEGPQKNFTITFDESDADRDWLRFSMYFEITGNTSFRNDGHSFTWYTWCDICEQNLTEPSYSGLITTTEVIGGYNFSNQTLWFNPSQPTPPNVEMQISITPEDSMQNLAHLNYGVYLYGDDYVQYVDDHWDYYSSYPSEDLYFFSLVASPFVYIGAIIYSFTRGNKAFGKGLLSSIIAAIGLFGAFIVFLAFLFL